MVESHSILGESLPLTGALDAPTDLEVERVNNLGSKFELEILHPTSLAGSNLESPCGDCEGKTRRTHIYSHTPAPFFRHIRILKPTRSNEGRGREGCHTPVGEGWGVQRKKNPLWGPENCRTWYIKNTRGPYKQKMPHTPFVGPFLYRSPRGQIWGLQNPDVVRKKYTTMTFVGGTRNPPTEIPSLQGGGGGGGGGGAGRPCSNYASFQTQVPYNSLSSIGTRWPTLGPISGYPNHHHWRT